MFCARLLRTPKRFECSTGSNISTSTPVSAVKLSKPDEPDHSPIEKSNDNSKEFYVASRGSINVNDGLPFSPLAGGSNAKRKQVLNFQNTPKLNTSRPIVSSNSVSATRQRNPRNSISKNELKGIASDKVLEAIRDDLEKHPLQGLRTSPRDVRNVRRSMNRASLKPDGCSEKENKEVSRQRNSSAIAGTRGRTKSNIPMRRRSVSLQDLALIQIRSIRDEQNNASKLKYVTGKQSLGTSGISTNKQLKKSSLDLAKSKSLQGSNCKTISVRSKSNLTSSKVTDKKVNNSDVKSKIKETSDKVVHKTNNLINSNQNAIVYLVKEKSKTTNENIVAKSKTNSAAGTVTNGVATVVKSKTSEVSTKVQSKTSDVATKVQSKTSEVAPTSDSRTSEIATTTKSKTNQDCDPSKSKTDGAPDSKSSKTSHHSHSVTQKSKETTETTKHQARSKDGVIQESKTVDKSKHKTSVESKTSDVNCKQTDSVAVKPKSPSKRSTAVSNKESSEKCAASNIEDEKLKKTSGVSSPQKTKPKTSDPKSVVGAKIFAQENTLKRLSGEVAQTNNITNRDSCGSQRNSDTFQAGKTSFVKRKLYSQCGDFNDDSDNNHDSSFLVQKNNIRDIYCVKKKSGIIVEPKPNSGSDTSKNSDNQRMYSLRNNNKNVEDEGAIKNTCKFVTKILEDISSKNKQAESKETDKMETEKKKTSKQREETSDKVNTSSSDIFSACSSAKAPPKKSESKNVKKPKKLSRSANKNDIIKEKHKKKRSSKSSPAKSSKISKIRMDHSSDLIIVKKNRNAKMSAIDKIHNLSSNVSNVKDHSNDLIVVKKNSRNAKTNALDKIHNWSSRLNNSREQSRTNSPILTVSSKKKRTIVVNKECSYMLRQSAADDSNVSLSPHLRRAISKLREQQTTSHKKPVRRSLEVTLNKKKAVLSKGEHKTNRRHIKNYNEDMSVQSKSDRKEKGGGQVMAFRNGQLVTVNKGPSEYMESMQDDSFYSTTTKQVKPKKMTCNFDLNKPRLQDFEQSNVRQIGSLVSMYTQTSPTTSQQTIPLIRDPFEFKLLQKYAWGLNDSVAQHNEINSTLISQPPGTSSHQMMPYNKSMHAMVPKPTGAMNEFKMPMGNYMPGVSRVRLVETMSKRTTKVVNARPNETLNNATYSNRSILCTNPLQSLMNRRQHENVHTNSSYLQNGNINFTSHVGNSIPDFVRNPSADWTTTFRGTNPVMSSYSFCAKGAELMNNRRNDTTAVRSHHMNMYNNMGPGHPAVSRGQAEDNRKRKYAEDVGNATVYSKKSRYDDEMSLCSIAGNRAMSSTRIDNADNQSVTSNQSVCKFIMRAPLISNSNVNRQHSSSSRTVTHHQINKPNVQTISSAPHRRIVEQKQNETNFSDDMNETVISAQPYKTSRTTTCSMTQNQMNNNRQTGQENQFEHRQLKQMTMQDHRQVTKPTMEDSTLKIQNYRHVLDHREPSNNQLRANNEHSTQNHRLEDNNATRNTTVQKYKFSSDDVYNFGRKPATKEVRQNDDTFYFKGLYSKCSDISGIQTQNTTRSHNVDNTFRKPSVSTLSSVKTSSSTHNSSILEKYHTLHSTNRTPKRKHTKSTSSSVSNPKKNCPTNVGTPVNNALKNNVPMRDLVSPWRLL